MESKPKVDIVIPVYNEGERVLQTLDELQRKVDVPFRARFVYDSDSDTSLPFLRDAIQKNNLRNIEPFKNLYGRGALNAIKSGLESAEADYVLVTMADLSDDLAAVKPMVAFMDRGADIVCGSRYMKGGRQIGGPVIKKNLSRLAGLSLHWITGIPTHDISNSFKMYRREFLRSIAIESIGGFEIGLEILVKAHMRGKRIAEVPTTWTDRAGGKSNFKLMKWLPLYLGWYWKAIKFKLSGARGETDKQKASV